MAKRKFKPQGQRTVLGFDFGTKSIGVAIGQEITSSANPVQALKARDGIPNWDEIEAIVTEWQPDLIVVGLPLNMDGTPQPVTFAAKKFGNRLHSRYGIPVETQDERLSTVDARAQLFAQGGYRNLSKGNVDNLSAKLILESWFERTAI
ncbi:MAG: Holliday junction resolvase RuvX [Psychrosphaera sp.]|nr:Holliday junction resolvase RuvX [Psychrosphaera sp.]